MVVDYFERSNLSTKKAWNTLPVLKTLGNTTLTCTRKRDGYEITNIALTQGNRVEIHNEFLPQWHQNIRRDLLLTHRSPIQCRDSALH